MTDEAKLAAEVERLRELEREKESLTWRLIARAFKPVAIWIAAVGGMALVGADFIARLIDWGSKK